MSFSRRTTIVVFLTLIISVFTTLISADSEATAEPLHSLPVVQGPPILALPALHTLRHPDVSRVKFRIPQAKSASAEIVTQAAKVLDQFHTIQTNSKLDAVIAFAMAQIGDPYVWGGNGPDGWDCSGLMVGSYKQIGVSLPRTSRAQYTVGTPVKYGQWQPGDLLFYGSSASSIHHVVMYIGNGQIVHASTYGVPVKTAPVSGGGSDYFGARRIV